MKTVYFIYPNSDSINPRGIRINNIIKKLYEITTNKNYKILTLGNYGFKFKSRKEKYLVYNVFNIIHILFRYLGIYKFLRSASKKAKLLDPFIFIGFIIKLDILLRLAKEKNTSEIVFVVVISPFSSYILLPWLKQRFRKSRVIIDLGDPLYKNSARWNSDLQSRNIEENALRAADAIIVTNESTKNHFCQEYNLNAEMIHVIPQGVDIELIEESLTKDLIVEKGTMAYAGRFYQELRSPEPLFSFIQEQDCFRLNVYGNSVSRNIPNVTFYEKLSQKELFKELHKNEMLVFIDNKYGIQSSGKIFEILAFNKPVLFICGEEESEPYKTAKNYSNVLFSKNTKESIQNTLKNYSKSEITLTDKIKLFSWKVRAVEYLKVLKNQKDN